MFRIITEDQAIQIVGDPEELRQMVVSRNYQYGELAVLRTGVKLVLFPGKVLPRFCIAGDHKEGDDVQHILDALAAGRTRLLASQQVGNPIPECAPQFERTTL
ncbi:MAG: hypothetical protein AAB916_02220 [Patescibacteria group bacterium]